MAACSLTTVASLVTVIVVAIVTSVNSNPIKSDYLRARGELIEEEKKMRIGGKLSLTADEQVVSDILVHEKRRLMYNSRLNRTEYLPAISFYHSKHHIENTAAFKLIQRMPKGSDFCVVSLMRHMGRYIRLQPAFLRVSIPDPSLVATYDMLGALLHAHELSSVSLDWVVKNATYRDNVFMCLDRGGYIILRVFSRAPTNPECLWKNVKDERAASQDQDAFDLRLKHGLSLLSSDPQETFGSNARAWDRFSIYFAQLANLINYVPIWRDYIWQMLEELRADNVQYLEFRMSIPTLFELDGTKRTPEFGVELFRDVTSQFVKVYPEFSGAKIILSGIKTKTVAAILAEVKTVMNLSQTYPDVVKGYDLAGDEDFYNPIVYYIDALLYPSKLSPPYHLPYFFHAGETNWLGTVIDHNMLDALLLNTSRLGHGFGLPKHPRLLELVKQRDIAVEVNPISNQILCLVSDLRNHPMVPIMADDFPIVVGSDNFATWEALPLSHDLYVTFMDMSEENADLTFIKQLTINSIRYSAMNVTEKSTAMKLWQTKWDIFIQETIKHVAY